MLTPDHRRWMSICGRGSGMGGRNWAFVVFACGGLLLMVKLAPLTLIEGVNFKVVESGVRGLKWQYSESEEISSIFPEPDLMSQWKNEAEKETCVHLAAKNPSENSKSVQVLPKKVISKRTRFIFVVGLEGSGHHFAGPMLEKASNSRCPPLPTIKNGFKTTLAHDHMRQGLFGSNNTHARTKSSLESYARMVLDLVLQDKKQGTNTTYVLNTMCWMAVGELSYPNDFTTNFCHETDFVDVRVLADLMEAVGADFRVLVMYRNALDVLVSTVVNRRMGLWKHSVDLYSHITDKYIMTQQLERLDKKFVMCLNYDLLPSLPDGFREFFNLNATDEELTRDFKPRNSIQRRDREVYVRRYKGKYHALVEQQKRLSDYCGF